MKFFYKLKFKTFSKEWPCIYIYIYIDIKNGIK